MRNIIGTIFKILGVIIFIIFGIWGFFIELSIIASMAGFWGVVVAFMILPITFIAAPFYVLVVYGDWFPLLIIYGGGIIAAVLYGIGILISGEE